MSVGVTVIFMRCVVLQGHFSTHLSFAYHMHFILKSCLVTADIGRIHQKHGKFIVKVSSGACRHYSPAS